MSALERAIWNTLAELKQKYPNRSHNISFHDDGEVYIFSIDVKAKEPYLSKPYPNIKAFIKAKDTK